MTYLLQAEPDLGLGLDPAARRAAEEQLVVPVVSLERKQREGPWALGTRSDVLGLLLIEGLLLREVSVLDNGTAELLGPGDLIRPWDVDGGYDIPIRSNVLWTPLEPLHAAVLGAEFIAATAPWPSVLSQVCARGVERAQRRALYMSISSMRRMDQRLLILFWHLCERWGTAGPRGFTLRLPLTHEILAKLVGAHREPVTRALGQLADASVVTREPDGSWLIAPNLLERLN